MTGGFVPSTSARFAVGSAALEQSLSLQISSALDCVHLIFRHGRKSCWELHLYGKICRFTVRAHTHTHTLSQDPLLCKSPSSVTKVILQPGIVFHLAFVNMEVRVANGPQLFLFFFLISFSFADSRVYSGNKQPNKHAHALRGRQTLYPISDFFHRRPKEELTLLMPLQISFTLSENRRMWPFVMQTHKNKFMGEFFFRVNSWKMRGFSSVKPDDTPVNVATTFACYCSAHTVL